MSNSKANLPVMPQLFYTQKPSADKHLYIHPAKGEKTIISDFDRQVKNLLLPSLKKTITEMFTTTSFPQVEPKDCSPYCSFYLLCSRSKKE